MLLIFGRQCEKSTTIGNLIISLGNLTPYLRLLYVTASNPQMREFSDERLRAVIADSPILLNLTGYNITGAREVQNVQTKRWLNQSKVVLRSVYRSPDRVRGIAADVLAIDELQDVYTDSLPVIEETLFHCEQPDGPMSIYAGTPKTFDNPLEYYWSRYSTQNEWATKCSGCNTWNIITEENIGPEGLICKDCGREINPVDGQAQWVRTGSAGREWNGFRLPQPVVPYAYRYDIDMFERHWEGLLEKQKRYPRQKFLNEVMATSYDSGLKPITLAEVRECCIGDSEYVVPSAVGPVEHAMPIWAGVDWGTGEGSYTVLSLWAYDIQGRFVLKYAKRYEGMESEPEYTWKDIIRLCKLYKVTRIGSDWGFGFYTNTKLRKAFGGQKVLLYQHAGSQKEKVKWDKGGMKWVTHRSRVLQDCFTLMKRGPKSGGVLFPRWETMETFAQDILSIYTEYSEARRQIVFNHPRNNPDDFLHTMCYALLASQFDHPRRDLHMPGS